MGYHPGHQAIVRAQSMIDLRYFETLQELIAAAKRKNTASKEVDAAEKSVQEGLGFCTDDFHFMNETEIFTYNGGPERWGDDWVYDRFRTTLRTHIAALLRVLGPAAVKKRIGG